MRRSPDLLLLLAFSVLALLGVLHHEPWRDELQAWLIAANSASWPELIAHMRYEGHPAGWHTLLWGLSRIWHDPLAMQVAHAGLAIIAIALVALTSPFNRFATAGLATSYFLLFEYGLIARNYALGVVAVFAFCALYGTRRRSWWPLALVLALLTQTNLFGLWLALCLAGALALEVLQAPSLRARPAEAAAAGLLLVVAFAAAAWQIVPPADFGDAGRVSLFAQLDAARALGALQSVGWTLFPVPNVATAHWWNTNLMQTAWIGRKGWGLMLVLLGAALLTLRRRPMALGLFLVGSAGIAFVCSAPAYAEKMRYAGHVFVLYLAAWWLAHRPDGLGPERAPAGWLARARGWEAPALGLLLLAQAAGGIAAYALDWQRPFSRVRDVAGEVADKSRVVVSKDYVGAGVSAYLQRPVYLLESRRWGSYIVWNQARRTGADSAPATLATLVADGQPATLVVNEALNPFMGEIIAHQGAFPGFRLRLLDRLEGAIVLDESFRIYAVEPSPEGLTNPGASSRSPAAR